MSVRSLSLERIQALRLIRAGASVDRACKTLKLSSDGVRSLAVACRDVPDDVLARIERVLRDNAKLRRLVAGLSSRELVEARLASP